MVTWAFYYPNATMGADWDVLQAIVTLLQKFDKLPSLLHVKGHQDKDTSYANLSLAAQLNVDADKLAGEYQYPSNLLPETSPLIYGSSVADFIKLQKKYKKTSIIPTHAMTNQQN